MLPALDLEGPCKTGEISCQFQYILLTYCPNRPASSTFRWFLGRYFSSLFTILSRSLFTTLRFTDAASPCCQISLRLYMTNLLVPIPFLLDSFLPLTFLETFEPNHHFLASHSQVL